MGKKGLHVSYRQSSLRDQPRNGWQIMRRIGRIARDKSPKAPIGRNLNARGWSLSVPAKYFCHAPYTFSGVDTRNSRPLQIPTDNNTFKMPPQLSLISPSRSECIWAVTKVPAPPDFCHRFCRSPKSTTQIDHLRGVLNAPILPAANPWPTSSPRLYPRSTIPRPKLSHGAIGPRQGSGDQSIRPPADPFPRDLLGHSKPSRSVGRGLRD